MLLVPPSPFVAALGVVLVPLPVFLFLTAALAVVGSVAVVLAALRAERTPADPPILVAPRRLRRTPLSLPEAA